VTIPFQAWKGDLKHSTVHGPLLARGDFETILCYSKFMSTKKFTDLNSSIAKLVLFTCISVSVIASFAAMALNIAIPKLQEDLGATITQVQWITNSYVLMLGIFILISGVITDKISRKKVLSAGLIIFTFASLILGFIENINLFILFRFVQGFGAALVIPAGLAIINTNYDSKIRGYVIGLWSGLTGLVSIFSPILAGLFVDTLGWRSIFFMIVPLSILCLILVLVVVKDQKILKSSKGSNDYLGILLLIFGFAPLSYGLIQGSEISFTEPIISGSIAFSIATLVFLYFVEKEFDDALISIKILKTPHILGANFFTLIFYGMLSGLFFYLILFLQQGYGLDATTAALYTLPPSIIITLMTFLTGKLADKYDERLFFLFGGSIVALGILWTLMIDSTFDYWTEIFPSLFLIGLGFGIFVPALTKTALDISEKHSGFASGINNSIARFAPLIVIAFFSFLILTRFENYIDNNLDDAEFSEQVESSIENQKNKLLDVSGNELLKENAQAKEFINKGFLEGYEWAVISGTILCLIGTGVAVVSTWRR